MVLPLQLQSNRQYDRPQLMSAGYLKEIDYSVTDFGDFYDELPLWSAPFGLLLLDRDRVERWNFENAAAVVHACFRAARPGARLFLTTNLVGHMHEFYEIYRATLIELDLLDRLPALDAHVAHRGTLDTVSALLRDAGFAVVDHVTDSFRMRFSDGSSLLRHHLIRVGFIPGWKSIVPADQLDRTFETLECNLNACAKERGEIALTIPMACFAARKPDGKQPGIDAAA